MILPMRPPYLAASGLKISLSLPPAKHQEMTLSEGATMDRVFGWPQDSARLPCLASLSPCPCSS